jgi:lipopolysaccharide export system protein LptA
MKSILISLIIILVPSSGALYALSSDQEKLFHIQADGAEIDESTGTSIYRGRVTVDQGTMHIAADEIEIHTHDSEVIQIIARMNSSSEGLAHYEQLPDDDAELISADAREINYMIQEEKLHLTGRAKLHQLPNQFEGELLQYDVKLGIVNLKGSVTPDNKSGRINMTLNPKKH